MSTPDLPQSVLNGGDPWINQAREGSREAIDQLLRVCRDYLLLIANRELNVELHAKVSPSDLVQETLLVGYEKFGDFRGSTQDEFFVWIRRILINRCHDAQRRLGAVKRSIDREVTIHDGAGDRNPSNLFVDSDTSPSQRVVLDEQASIIQEVVESLPEAYRTVLRLRGWECQSFEQIAESTQRSVDATRKLWYRALQQIGEALRTRHDDLGISHKFK